MAARLTRFHSTTCNQSRIQAPRPPPSARPNFSDFRLSLSALRPLTRTLPSATLRRKKKHYVVKLAGFGIFPIASGTSSA